MHVNVHKGVTAHDFDCLSSWAERWLQALLPLHLTCGSDNDGSANPQCYHWVLKEEESLIHCGNVWGISRAKPSAERSRPDTQSNTQTG